MLKVLSLSYVSRGHLTDVINYRTCGNIAYEKIASFGLLLKAARKRTSDISIDISVSMLLVQSDPSPIQCVFSAQQITSLFSMRLQLLPLRLSRSLLALSVRFDHDRQKLMDDI